MSFMSIGLIEMALVGFRGVGSGSCDQGCNERAKQGFAATACVVHELEEAEIERQLLLRETAVRTEPGAQERSSDQNPSMVLTCTSQKPSPSSSRAYSPCAWQTVLCVESRNFGSVGGRG